MAIYKSGYSHPKKEHIDCTTKINNAYGEIAGNQAVINSYEYVVGYLDKAINGIEYMKYTQIDKTKTSTKEAYHIDETYYNDLDLQDKYLEEDIVQIKRNVKKKIDDLQSKNSTLHGNIDYWQTK